MAASFRKKRHNNKWPVPHRIASDCKITYIRKTNEWKFSWVYETQKQLRETQAEFCSLTLTFTWYSPTKGVGKIGQYDIGRIIRLCKHMDNLLSIKDKLLPLVQNVRRKRPCDLIVGCDKKSNTCKAKFMKRVSRFLLAD